jgi:PII-like signaling protein
MKGSQLTVYADSRCVRTHHMNVVKWLLDEIDRAGIQGATVISASESIDRHGKYHAARFFELVDQPVAVTVAADESHIDALLARLRESDVSLFYTRCPVEFAVLGGDAAVPAHAMPPLAASAARITHAASPARSRGPAQGDKR